MNRTKTATGEVVTFAARDERRGEPPKFERWHPGTEWMRYVSTLVTDGPLINPEAIPQICWQHPREPGGPVTGRLFVSCGRKLMSRADVELIAVMQDMEDDE